MSFWIAVAALLALALVILVVPLMRAVRTPQGDQRQQQNIQIAREKKGQIESRFNKGEIDQETRDSACLDLQTSLALELGRSEADEEKSHGKWMAIVVFLAIPAASVSLYLVFGEYRVIGNPQLMLEVPRQAATTAPQMSLEEMTAAIEQRLRDDPEDSEGWFMLGRVMMSSQRYSEAVTAFQRSGDLVPDEPGTMFALADALAMQNNGNLLGEPEALVQRGLKLAPRYPNGLWLAGMIAEQRRDYKTAHRYWSLLLAQVADNPASSREIRGLLAKLEEREPGLAKTVSASNAGGINLRVEIGAELKARVSPDATVFVYARAMEGPSMPLAVKKLQLGDLPVSLTLSDADAVMPTMKLSSFSQVVVGARVSSSGNPLAQSGDFYTERESVDSDNPPSQINLIIDQIK